jgi:hypothetical protein
LEDAGFQVDPFQTAQIELVGKSPDAMVLYAPTSWQRLIEMGKATITTAKNNLYIRQEKFAKWQK